MNTRISLTEVIPVLSLTAISFVSTVGMVGLLLSQFAYSPKDIRIETQVKAKSVTVELVVDSIQQNSTIGLRCHANNPDNQ